MIELELQKFGLNEKEVKVYLAALELGYASAQNIAKKANINRATAYFIIEGLTKKGLMTEIEKDKKTYFAAEDPKSLGAVLDKKVKEAEEIQHVFKEILPQLESIYNLSLEKPKIRYYEGNDGILAMRSEFLHLKTDKKEIVGFVCLDKLLAHSPQHGEHTGRRIQKGVKSRVIYTRNSGVLESASDEKLLREARYVPQNKFPFSSDISIYGDRVSMIFLKEKIGGVMIENGELADMMRAIFELAWEGAEKYQK